MTAQRPLHVHVLIDALGLGGAETLVGDFVLAARKAGLEVSVGHLAEGGAAAQRLAANGLEPVHVPVGTLLGPRARRAVREHVARVAPDVLHTHLGYADLLGGLAARALGIATVSTLHLAAWEGAARERARLWLMAQARRRCAARVIAVSDASRRGYLAMGWDRPERVVVVHNGIVDAARPGGGAQMRRELAIGPDELVLGMVSVLRGGKGHEAAAGAVERLLSRFANLRLVIVGDGPRRAEIERATRGLGDRVLFTGYRHDVVELLDAVDVLVHPSEADAFPTVVLEAMAARVPVVATDVGGIPESVVDGQTGTLIAAPARPPELAAALEPLLAQPQLRRRMGSLGRERFEAEFSAERWIDRTLPIYELALRATAAARR